MTILKPTKVSTDRKTKSIYIIASLKKQHFSLQKEYTK